MRGAGEAGSGAARFIRTIGARGPAPRGRCQRHDNQPTEVMLPVSAIDIPTLGTWSLAFFAPLLLVMACAVLGRRGQGV